MATDTNAFDAYLKDRLHRDILFRIGIWSAIAASAGAYATRKAQFSGFDYFEKAADLLLPLLNLFGSISVFLVLIALFFKDVEHVHPRAPSSFIRDLIAETERDSSPPKI